MCILAMVDAFLLNLPLLLCNYMIFHQPGTKDINRDPRIVRELNPSQ